MRDARQARFLALLEPVYYGLSRYALGVTGNEDDAEDLVSETILIAFEQLEKLERADNVLRYLITIAWRLNKRKQYRERRKMPFNRHHAEQRKDPSIGPDGATDIRIVLDALETLPAKTRETMVLFGVSGFSLEEIRRVQGGTLSGVKSRLKRGREQLAALLDINETPRKIEQSDSSPVETKLDMPFMIFATEHYVH